MTLGGVGRNLATGLELLGHEPIFITSLASDNLAEFALNEMAKFGLGLAPGGRQQAIPSAGASLAIGATTTSGYKSGAGDGSRLKVLNWCPEREGERSQVSSCFALVLIDSLTGQCEYVIANLDACRAISSKSLDKLQFVDFDGDSVDAIAPSPGVSLSEKLALSPLVVLDSNLPGKTLEHLLKLCHNSHVPVFLEPTDVVCLPNVVDSLDNIGKREPQLLGSLAYLSPNIVELNKLLELFNDKKRGGFNKEQTIIDDFSRDDEHSSSGGSSLDRIEAMARQLMQIHLPQLKCLLVTMDKQGVLVGTRLSSTTTNASSSSSSGSSSFDLELKHYRPTRVIESPVSASGAGDCFAAGFISGLIDELPMDECVELGFKAATCALNDKSTVPISLRQLAKT